HFMGILGAGCNGHPGKQADYTYDPNVGKSYITNERFVEELPSIAANVLETVSFGNDNNISDIYYGAFQNQSHMTSIDFGTSEAELTIWSGAFAGVGNNAYLVENGVDESLGEGIELELPANLVDLKNGAFTFAGLRSVAFADGIGISDVKHGVFQDVNVMEELVIGSDYPSDVLEGGVFSRCPELTEIDLSESGITTIEDALKEDPKLTKVIFPKDLTTITWAEHPEDRWDENDPEYTRDKICPFYGCDNVNVLRFLQTDPDGFNFDEGVFQFLNEEGIVYVPEETTDEAIEDYIALLTDCGLTFAEDRWVIERYVELNGITLDPEEVELETEDVIALAVFFDPEDATEKDVVWSSSDEEVATVDENGVVTAVAPGTAQITAQSAADEDIKAVCAVTVKAKTIAVTGVSVDPAEVSLKVGKTKELTAVLEPENATNKNVTWSSSDEEVATVDENGKVTAVAAGTAEITVKTEDGEFTAVCTVKVTKKSSGGGSSSGSDDKPVSKIEVPEETENGEVTVEKDKAAEGSKVTIKVDPDEGYVVDEVTVTDKKGNKIPVTDNGDGTYTFTMPDTEVSVDASFKKKEPVSNPFADIRPSDYFYDAVLWAYENGITDGTDATHFSPSKSCSRGQMVTFLWRAAGSPEPKSGTCPFTDIDSGAYYYKAVLWAYENGITEGTSPTTFSPNGTETRAQTVTFLWRWNGKPAPKLAESSFTDIPQDTWYTEAVLWAVENGITEGTSPTTFSPDKDCTRAQIVTFLYRGMAE
ncbi:MAG: Ig-like domain-containing protein, partial [Firmicutes bacterium]|nr:Ig-like domain-containing protein [Bacillota bacterium]